jgi:putative transcriptional regulator
MSAIGLHRFRLIVAAFVLQTALLRAALSGPDEAQARPSLVGQLLVAALGVGDPRFERTVILIVEQGPDGTLGIVVNKPIGEQPLASVFKALGQKDGDATGSVRVFSGGPVQPEVGFVVHSPDYRRPETVAITDRLSMTSSMAILRDIGDRRGPAKVLVAFGYAGWGPDQLEHEIEQRAWGSRRPTQPSFSTRTGTMSGKMPGSIAPSISERAQVHESGVGRTFLRPRVTPTHHALGLFRARLFQGARKRQPVSASLRRAGAARLLRARYREDNFWKHAVCSAPGGGDRRPAPKGARRDRLESGIVT